MCRATITIVVVFMAAVSAAQQAPSPELAPQGRGTPISYYVAFGGDGRWLAQGANGGIRIFDVATGRIARELAAPSSAGAGLGMSFAAHPHGDVIVTCDASGALVAIDVATGTELWRTLPVPIPKSRYNLVIPASAELRFSSDGAVVNARIVTTSMGLRGMSGHAYRRRVDARNGRLLTDFDEGKTSDTFYSVGNPFQGSRPAFSDDGRWLHVTRRTKQGERTRFVDAGKPDDAGHELVGIVAASHAGANRAVMTAPGNPLLTLVEVSSGRPIGTAVGASARFSNDGTRILVTNRSSFGLTWRLLDALEGRTVAEAPSDTPLTLAWAIAPDGRQLGTVQQDKLVLANSQAPITYNTITPGPAMLATNDDARSALGSTEMDDRLKRLTDVLSGQWEPSAAFSRNGRWLVARASDNQIDVWDTATGNRMPFRLPAPTFQGGGLIVRETAQLAGAARGWQPLAVDASGSSVERVQKGDYQPPTGCGRPCGPTSCPALLEFNDEELLNAGIDTAWGGCSASPDGARVVVSATEQPGKRLSRSLACVFALKCSARLAVFDVARRHATPLFDDDPAAPAKFSFVAEALQWSPDSAFVVAESRDGGDIRLRVWDATTGRLLDPDGNGFRGRRMVGFVAPTARLATASVGAISTSDVDVWDLHSRTRLVRFSGLAITPSPGSPLAMNDRVLLGPGTSGEVWIRSMKSGGLIGQLRVLANGDWLVTTPSGLFDGSPGGWRQLAWRVGDGVNVSTGELYFNEFYQPGLLADLLADRGLREVRAVSERDRRQPTVGVAAEAIDQRLALVRVSIAEAPPSGSYTSGSGARDVRLFRNGVLVHVWRDAIPLRQGAAQLEARVTLVAGRNHFAAYGFNNDNIKSVDAETDLTLDLPPRERTVYVLAIGINRYSNSQFDLSYAVPDATVFGAEFARAQRTMGATRIRVVTLLDDEATRRNIMLALARLGSAQEVTIPADAPAALQTLERAQPEDTVVVYFAGHGMARDDRFHLIPADLEYTGTRAAAQSSLDQLLARSISDRDLEQAFEPIDARHLLLVIDACNSGQALSADDARFGPMNSRGLAQLAYEKGMFVLTASQAYQAALESKDLGHGYLTYALVNEGLRQAVADITPTDGNITAREWFEYAASRVPQLQLDAMTRAEQTGRLLTFGPVEQPVAGELQTPRLFSRRDDEDEPLIVARP